MIKEKKGFLVKTRNIVSIEIGDKTLKLAYLKVTSDKKEVINIAAYDIIDVKDDVIVSKIKEFIKSQHINKAEVINVIPSNFAISKNIEIPSSDEREIRDIIELQAGRHTPYSREEIIMDYAEIGISHNRYTKVLLTIIKRDIVVRRYELIKKAGFKAERAVLASEAILLLCSSFLESQAKDKPIAIVHIDGTHMDFIVGHNDRCVYTRSMPMDIVRLFSGEADEKQKCLEELKKSVESYKAENIEELPSLIYFSGTVDAFTKMKEDINDFFRMNIEVLFYYNMLSVSDAIKGKIKDNPCISFLSVVSCAYILEAIRLNLIPEDVRMRKEIKRQAKRIVRMGILAMAVIVFFCVTLLMDMFFKKIYLRTLLLSYTKESQEASKLKDILEKTRIVKRFLDQKERSLFVLTELFKAMPQEIYLNSISLGQ
ncbi:MAG: pilus assembly protein PilM, partial [Candidatus Omnitrophota bacterium]